MTGRSFTEQEVLALAKRAYAEGRTTFEVLPNTCVLLAERRKCPANLQKFSARGTDNRFANHIKEKIHERRERAISPLVPLMRIKGVSQFEQRCLIDEPEEQATQEKETCDAGRTLSDH